MLLMTQQINTGKVNIIIATGLLHCTFFKRKFLLYGPALKPFCFSSQVSKVKQVLFLGGGGGRGVDCAIQ